MFDVVTDMPRLLVVTPVGIAFTRFAASMNSQETTIDGKCLILLILTLYNSYWAHCLFQRDSQRAGVAKFGILSSLALLFNLVVLIVIHGQLQHVDGFLWTAYISLAVGLIGAVSWLIDCIRLNNDEHFAGTYDLTLVEVAALRRANNGIFPAARAQEALSRGLDTFRAHRQELLFDHYGVDCSKLVPTV